MTTEDRESVPDVGPDGRDGPDGHDGPDARHARGEPGRVPNDREDPNDRDDRDGPEGREGGDGRRGARRRDGRVGTGGREDAAALLDRGLAAPAVIDAAELRDEEPHWFNVPNAVTFLRALLVPVILWLLTLEGEASQWWAFGIFVFAALTDSIDGWVARRWHGVTRWGQLADPIADKLLIIGSLASLAAVGDLPWWAVIVIVVREVAVTIMRVSLVSRHNLVLPASIWGKVKTVSQVIAVSLYLYPGVPAGLRSASLWVAVILTVASGLTYALHVFRLLHDDTEQP